MARRLPAPVAMVLVALALLVAPPASAAGGASPPAAVPLTSGWSYHPDPGNRGLIAGWQLRAPKDGWRPVTLPHVFDAQPDKADFRGTIGWYRITFRGPRAAPGFGWGVNFQAARRVAFAWLNGRTIGVNRDPYVPFTLPASGIRAGRENTLVVRVDNRKSPAIREGWWNWGGLTRGVTLVPRGALELRDRGLMSDVRCPSGGGDGCTARSVFDGTVVNRSGAAHDDVTVSVSLTPPGGGTPITHTQPVRALQPGESTRVRFSFPVPDPKLWSPESPSLYAATITTRMGGSVTQVNRQQTGLRSVQVVDGLLELNGRQLDLRGAAIQEDVDGHGAALTDQDVAGIVAGLKAVHANITRAHYLLDRRLLDAFDRAGILVWSQAPIYHRDKELLTPGERQVALDTLRGTVTVARNHPSVITHSVANELSVIPDSTPGTKAYLDAAVRDVRDLDPTLPVSVDLLSYPGYPAQQTYAQFDLLGINSYFGWYPGKKDHSTANIADLGPFLDRMRQMYPRQALVLTEFGAESTFAGPATEKETYAFQSRYIQDVLRIVETRPFVGGAIYWTLREFAVKPDWDGGAKRDVPRDSIHNKGLITYAGQRKPAWAIAERDFAETPLYRTVSPAVAKGLPTGGDAGGPPLLIWGVVVLVAGLIVLDTWAMAGILRRRREADAAAVDAREYAEDLESATA